MQMYASVYYAMLFLDSLHLGRQTFGGSSMTPRTGRLRLTELYVEVGVEVG